MPGWHVFRSIGRTGAGRRRRTDRGRRGRLWLLALACVPGISEALAAPLALDDVLVIASAGADTPQRSALTLFVDEAQRRTGRRWPVRFGAPNRDSTRLRLIAAREDQLAELLPAVLSTRLHGCEALKR